MADPQRARKMADRIKEIVARRIDAGLRDPRLGFVTITDVRVTGDLQHASIFYTVYGTDEERADSAVAMRENGFRALKLRVDPHRAAQGLADEAVLYFEPGAGAGYVAGHDAYKFRLNGSGRPTLWSTAGPDALSINGLNDLATAGVVPLGVRVSVAGPHTLVLTSRLSLAHAVYPAAHYANLRELYRRLLEKQGEQLVVQKKAGN